MDDLIDLMCSVFKVREIREIAEYANYDVDKITKAFKYMQEYGSDIEVPIAFMKNCIHNEYYANTSKFQAGKKNSFNNFTQNSVIDFDELERQLLDN